MTDLARASRRRRLTRALLLGGLFIGTAGIAAVGAEQERTAPAAADTAPPPGPTRWGPGLDVPFVTGESLAYSVKFGFLRVGSGSMYVKGHAVVRGQNTIHTLFRITGGTMFFKVNDLMQSWIEPEKFASLRFHQDIAEGGYKANRRYEFFPERKSYTENDKPEKPSVESPLDDGSFLYFIRTQLLEVGKEYAYDRYFDPEANPVRIKVLRKEKIRVPAGEFDAIVLQPIIKTSGIFSEGGEATIWLSDDSRRMVLQLKSKLNFGSLNLYLLRYRLAEGGTWLGEDP
jgi:hypothetical protein